MLYYYLLLVLTILFIVYKYRNRNKDYWKQKNIVQEEGVLQTYITRQCSLGEVYLDIYKKYPNEKYIGVFLNEPALIVKDLNDVHAVLQGDFQNFFSRGTVQNPRDVLADNVLFIDDYPRWRLIRQKMTPIFTSRKLKNMFYIMDRIACDFISNDNNVQLTNTDSFHALSVYTTACIAATVFGLDGSPKNYTDSPFLHMVRDVIGPNFAFNFKFSVSTISPRLFNLLNLKFFDAYKDFFVGAFKQVIDRRRRDRDPRHDFIDTCIELQNSGRMQDAITGYELDPSDEVLAAQAFFFFLAGVDTSATTMHFVLLELASNPKVLARLHQEIDEAFTKCGDALTYDAVDNMQYLEMVLNESMRKHSPIAQIQRQCVNKTTLPGGLRVEKDEIIVIPIHALHRDENNFPNADVFDPERFSPENIKNIKRASFLPFGGGNRVCIGERLARLQVKSGVAWFLRNHTLKEQAFNPKKYDQITFANKDTNAGIKLIPRN
ncbi:probable cytochrome P450 6a13 [Aricia agestis]|uniref:probable cytochrome P450 6a13 n=1 Tax=Aricia agestis TaxID=91739 RepID=UPI001C207FE5|nr:probable cytochrome P450 6a13 [Aricia agestis]XP_041984762.1 probable cytochrome P450 6a13 [Aricia agestis]